MTIYNFTRELVNGAYDINNPQRLDGEGNQITLASEICVIPEFAQKFNINCCLSSCNITFNFTLTSEQETQLNTIVAAHKNNT
jgi:hypothetical protein